MLKLCAENPSIFLSSLALVRALHHTAVGSNRPESHCHCLSTGLKLEVKHCAAAHANAKSGVGVEGGDGGAVPEVKEEGVVACHRRLADCTPRSDAGGREIEEGGIKER